MIVVNDNYKKAPWADLLYACDDRWWVAHNGVVDFEGLRVTQDLRSVPKFNLIYVESRADEKGLSKEWIGQGSNSGHQAVCLAYLMGCREVMLLGFDYGKSVDGKRHWFGDHPGKLNVPSPYQNFRDAMDELSVYAKAERFRIINCSRQTTITSLPRMTIKEALCNPSSLNPARP